MLEYKNRKWMLLLTGVAVFSLLVTGCGRSRASASVRKSEEPSASVLYKGQGQIALEYNMAFKGVVVKVDEEAGVVMLKNTSGGADYTLTYSKGTAVLDKYGSSRVISEVQAGDLVDAYVNDKDNSLAGLVYSSENWEFEGSENWKFDTEKSELIIGKDKYYYMDDLVILSDGSEANIMDLNKSDILNIQGCGKKVLSVTLERGHGYVRLEGIEDFLGGWVEIGKVIKPVSEDMLIAVPEGNWDVTIVKDGYGGSIGTTVERNQEISVDFTGIASQIVRYGTVEFTIEPEDARLYVAGREMDHSKQLLLEYDTYKIRVSADGYKDYVGDLTVEKALTGKKVKLEKSEAADKPEGSASPVPGTAAPRTEPSTFVTRTPVTPLPEQLDPSAEPKATGFPSRYIINISSPEHVNVYFDDAFVGVSPVKITKVSGEHTITLSKAGYITKSYSIEIGTEERDVTFALPDLERQR